jgi:hypothetical protein
VTAWKQSVSNVVVKATAKRRSMWNCWMDIGFVTHVTRVSIEMDGGDGVSCEHEWKVETDSTTFLSPQVFGKCEYCGAEFSAQVEVTAWRYYALIVTRASKFSTMTCSDQYQVFYIVITPSAKATDGKWHLLNMYVAGNL